MMMKKDLAAVSVEKKEAKAQKELVVAFVLYESLGTEQYRVMISRNVEACAKTATEQAGDAAGQVRWALVSFGKHPVAHVMPTADAAELKVGLEAMPRKTSGVADAVRALEFVCGKSGRGPLTVVLVTVRVPHDSRRTTDAKTLERTIDKLKRAKVKVHTLGPEANFASPVAYRPAFDGAGRIVGHGWTTLGVDSSEPEGLTRDMVMNRNVLHLPCGFGSFPLVYLAQETGGRSYIAFGAPSGYDEAKMKSDYAPEMVSENGYMKRRRASKVRAVLHLVWREWHAKHSVPPPIDGRTKLRKEMATAAKAQKWAAQARRALAKRKRQDKWRPERWAAHRDLTAAQLAKLEFLYGQYVIALGNAAKSRRQGRLRVDFASEADPLPGGKAASKARELAKELLQEVALRHAGTPWAALAAKDLADLRPLVVRR